MASKSEEPTVELYMYSLNQEFPVGKGHQTYLKRFSELSKDITGDLAERVQVEAQVFGVDPKLAAVPSDWRAQWLENQWIENHTKAIGMGRRPDLDPLRTAIMREEEFGAIVFEPRSDRVYKLNRAGAELFKALQAEHLKNEGEPKVRQYAGFKTDTVEGFVRQLKAAGLWSLQ
ncbi:hypothetical protein [Stappia sp.]|uniref:hypothetical protein n=1 Tax=Stappia sp. TaxID=1870903 RepID=UPI003D09A352